MGDLDELREMRDARSHRDGIALELAGPSLPIPLLVRRRHRFLHTHRKPDLSRQGLGHRGVTGHHAVKLLVARQCEVQADPEAMQHRVARSEPPQTRRCSPGASRAVEVLVALQPDVVAEPLRLFMRIGVAPDVREQRGVIHDRALVDLESETLGDA